MSTKEVRRAAVFAQVKAGKAVLSVVAQQLGLSYRQAKRLYARYKTRGHVGLRHGNLGKRSNRALGPRPMKPWSYRSSVSTTAVRVRGVVSGLVRR
jgi:hypothetical protein